MVTRKLICCQKVKIVEKAQLSGNLLNAMRHIYSFFKLKFNEKYNSTDSNRTHFTAVFA